MNTRFMDAEGMPFRGWPTLSAGGPHFRIFLVDRRGGWPRLTFFFPLDGDHQREDSTVLIHRTDKTEGALRVGSTRRGVVTYRHHRFGQRIKTGNDEIKSPTRKPDA